MRIAAFVVSACVAAAVPVVGRAAAPSSGGNTLQTEAPFTLAALRRDGIAVPFAAFDGRRWQAPWPADLRLVDLPISLADVPERWWGTIERPSRMTHWRRGVRSGEVAITGLTTTRLMCEPRMSLRTDYTSSEPIPLPLEVPHPKDGLLVAGGAAIGAITAVEPASREWEAAIAAITEAFNRTEEDEARAFSRWQHPFDRQQRSARPIMLEALYRAPMDEPGWTAYFVEALRQYPPGPQDKDGCGLVTFGWGWILAGPKQRPRVHLSARVTYCDRDGVRYMLPFGTVRARGRTYWVFQHAGFDTEWYEVMRPSPRGVASHVSYPAGRCFL